MEDELKTLEGRLRDGGAPKWIDAVAVGKKHDRVMMHLGAFAGEPALLYDALRYAQLSGVTVMIAPNTSIGSDTKAA